MPCYDSRNAPGYSEDTYSIQRALIAEARLCAIMRVLEARGILGKVIDQADWCEAGTAEYPIQDWWKEHKKEDAKRHKEVEADAKRQAVAHEAYKSLTPAQRKALGLRAGRNPVSRKPLHQGIDAPSDPSDEDEGDEEV